MNNIVSINVIRKAPPDPRKTIMEVKTAKQWLLVNGNEEKKPRS